ncbi:MAG: hypothetical protein PV353_06020, partial [Bartonella sp.]|nr:hypothetical protein [Bartonella sp.]
MSTQTALNLKSTENKIEQILFSHTDKEDIAFYKKDELHKATNAASEAFKSHQPGKSTICFENALTRHDKSITVITLVNDNKPFLL